jgi:pimeloyl-ACP methyl ester carboxylesterase
VLFVYLSLPSNLLARNLSSVAYYSDILLTCNIEIPTPAHTLTHPTLLISSTDYIITVTANFPELMRPFVPDFKVENVNGGHWLQLEKADEVNKILDNFMEEKRAI